ALVLDLLTPPTLYAGTDDDGIFAMTITLQQFTLTMNLAGTGSGTVTSTPAGISCPAACSAAFDSGTSVTLTAAAASGSTFAGWSGEGCSGPGTCTVSMTQARSVTATFIATPSLTLTKVGSGTVTSTPTGISCDLACTSQT